MLNNTILTCTIITDVSDLTVMINLHMFSYMTICFNSNEQKLKLIFHVIWTCMLSDNFDANELNFMLKKISSRFTDMYWVRLIIMMMFLKLRSVSAACSIWFTWSIIICDVRIESSRFVKMMWFKSMNSFCILSEAVKLSSETNNSESSMLTVSLNVFKLSWAFTLECALLNDLSFSIIITSLFTDWKLWLLQFVAKVETESSA